MPRSSKPLDGILTLMTSRERTSKRVTDAGWPGLGDIVSLGSCVLCCVSWRELILLTKITNRREARNPTGRREARQSRRMLSATTLVRFIGPLTVSAYCFIGFLVAQGIALPRRV